MDALLEEAKAKKTAWRERFALRVSFWANVVLLAVKVFAAVSSGSLSIITSALDSFLDLVSGLILYFTEKSMRKQNKYLFPAGKSRMQPLGIIVFSCIMGTLGFQILLEGVQQLVGYWSAHGTAVNAPLPLDALFQWRLSPPMVRPHTAARVCIPYLG